MLFYAGLLRCGVCWVGGSEVKIDVDSEHGLCKLMTIKYLLI